MRRRILAFSLFLVVGLFLARLNFVVVICVKQKHFELQIQIMRELNTRRKDVHLNLIIYLPWRLADDNELVFEAHLYHCPRWSPIHAYK